MTVSIGWRWVFLGLVPLVVVGVTMLVVVVRRFPTHTPATGGRRAGVPQAIIAALGVAALTWAAQHQSFLALGYGTRRPRGTGLRPPEPAPGRNADRHAPACRRSSRPAP